MATSSISTLSSPGIGSGLDVKSIVSQLVAAESGPLTKLTTDSNTLQTKLSTVGQLQSLVSTFRDAAVALTKPDAFTVTNAVSSDTTTASATAANGAAAGSYAVTVNALASGQTIVSPSGLYASPTAATGTGTFTLRSGKWSDDGTTFTPDATASDVTITIGAGDATLQGVSDKINAANAGVTASIVTDASGSRLAIRSNGTGADHGFRLQATEDAATGTPPPPGLSKLAYDPPGGTSAGIRVLKAGNAAASINGIDVTSEDNTFAGVVQGVTFTASKVNTTPATVTVSLNTDAIKSLMAKFVTAYNGVSTFISSQTAYDPTTKTSGLFQGDSTMVSVQNQLRNMLGQPGTGSSTFGTLSSLGIQLQKDGTLKLDDTVAAAALKNPTEVAKALAGTSVATADTTSLAKRFSNWGDLMLNAGGTLSSRTASFQRQIADNQKRQIEASDRLDTLQKRLTAQYAALDTTVSQSQSLNAFVTRQFASSSSSG